MEELFGSTSIRQEDVRRFHAPAGKSFLPSQKASSGRYTEICPDLASSEPPIREIEELVRKLKSLVGVDCINVYATVVTVAKFPQPFTWERLGTEVVRVLADFLRITPRWVNITRIGEDEGGVPIIKPSV